jgi:hypothetical protein
MTRYAYTARVGDWLSLVDRSRDEFVKQMSDGVRDADLSP